MEEIYSMLIQTVSTVGFPIAITVYLLWERQNIMKEFISAVNTLTDTVATLKTIVEIKKD